MKKIIVIGAGIIGLSISYYLKKHNFDIAVIEKNKAGIEASYAAAGMLAAQSEFDFYEDFMNFCVKSRDMYEDFCREIEGSSGIKAELTNNGFIIPALTEAEEDFLKQKYEWQKKKRFDVQLLDNKELAELEPNISDNIRLALHIKNDLQVNNRKLMEALIISNKKNGVRIIEDCEVRDYIVKDSKINGTKTNIGNFYADVVINAAGSWSSLISQGLIPNFRVKPILGQMLSLASSKKILEKTIFAIMKGKGCYIVPRNDNTIVLGSTMEDVGFEKRVTDQGINGILNNAIQIVPKLKNSEIKEKWAGFRPTTADQFPIIGKTNIENLLLATAHGRNGILLAPITAKAIEELVANGNIIPEIKDFGVERFNNKN